MSLRQNRKRSSSSKENYIDDPIDLEEGSGEFILNRKKKNEIENNSKINLLLLVVFIDVVGVSLVIPLLPYYAKKLNGTNEDIGALGSFYGLLQLIGSPIMGKLSDSLGRKSVLCISLGAAGLSYFAMTFSTSLYILYLSRIPVGLCKQTMSIANTMVTDLSEVKARSKYIGRVNTALGLGFIVGPLIAGMISQYDLNYPAYISVFLYIIDLILVIFFLPDTKKKTSIYYTN
eukprot:TRINITY_DN8697_c0_g1_i1.p1 TRINITY_DN8697_c0_g1~~TRINITY_DN8697_c0_g1_i1.p1  ORF type:complete len:232 (-),score=55.32 TRINITY_DN8697_c0_g1_i1:591-1286(-)